MSQPVWTLWHHPFPVHDVGSHLTRWINIITNEIPRYAVSSILWLLPLSLSLSLTLSLSLFTNRASCSQHRSTQSTLQISWWNAYGPLMAEPKSLLKYCYFYSRLECINTSHTGRTNKKTQLSSVTHQMATSSDYLNYTAVIVATLYNSNTEKHSQMYTRKEAYAQHCYTRIQYAHLTLRLTYVDRTNKAKLHYSYTG